MDTTLQPKASPWQPNANSQMNVTAMPFRPPPFSLSHTQDPLVAAGLAHQHGSPSGSLGPIGSHSSSPNPSTAHLGPPPSLSLHGHPSTPMGSLINPVTGQGMVGLGSYTQHSGMMASGGGIPGANSSLTGPPTGAAGGAVKYKTELCRNWEATGQCAYRGCTFAHGHDDLRNGTPVAGVPQPMMMMHPSHNHSTANTPQQHTYSFTNNVVNANAVMTNAGLPPVASGRSSTLGTPVAGTYRIGGGGMGLVGPGGLGTGLNAPVGVGAGSTSPLPAAPAPIQTTMPQPISMTAPASPAEALMELIMLEIRAERDKLFTQQTHNRQLEQQLKREQLMRQRNVNNTTLVTGMIADLEEAIRRRHAALTDIKRACGEDAMEAVVEAMIDSENF